MCSTYAHNALKQTKTAIEIVPDLTIDLPDELHERLHQIAKAEGTDAETLVHQTITLSVGYNPSSLEHPVSTRFLERQTDDVILVANNEPVYFIDSQNEDSY